MSPNFSPEPALHTHADEERSPNFACRKAGKAKNNAIYSQSLAIELLIIHFHICITLLLLGSKTLSFFLIHPRKYLAAQSKGNLHANKHPTT